MQRDEKQLISWLQTRRVNTITELRRVEKAFITFPSPSPSPEAAESLTNAWLHYVNSNQLLNELRSLTKSYPFSSECLDEAKWLVIGDIDFSRSSNYCRVVLAKVMTMNLIQKHARAAAFNPDMWGGSVPSDENASRLYAVLVENWTGAVRKLLRNWDVR